MHQAIPYRSHTLNSIPATRATLDLNATSASTVRTMVADNAVIIFGKQGCCMCHVVRRLLLGHGVNPAVFEVDEKDEGNVIEQLLRITGKEELGFPVVFVGGKFFGGLEKLMSTHISGELVPILKDAGALWL